MTDKTELKVSLMPGADTPEGAARIQRELSARDEIDYRAFQALQRLKDEGLIDRVKLSKAIRDEHGESKIESKEWADEIMLDIEEIIKARKLADHKVLAALAGRSE